MGSKTIHRAFKADDSAMVLDFGENIGTAQFRVGTFTRKAFRFTTAALPPDSDTLPSAVKMEDIDTENLSMADILAAADEDDNVTDGRLRRTVTVAENVPRPDVVTFYNEAEDADVPLALDYNLVRRAKSTGHATWRSIVHVVDHRENGTLRVLRIVTTWRATDGNDHRGNLSTVAEYVSLS